MSFSAYKMTASIAVSDMDQAQEFYERRLGLSAVDQQADGSRIYACAGGASLHVYPSPDHAGKAPATPGTWCVPDLELVVDELNSKGVAFERYDEPPLQTDERGSHRRPTAESRGSRTPTATPSPSSSRRSRQPIEAR